MMHWHFLHPIWLLALPLLAGLLVWLRHRRAREGAWGQLIDAPLLALLRVERDRGPQRTLHSPWVWLALAWTLAVLALAGPTWQQASTPAYRLPVSWVLVLDLSPSMDATDLPPNRVTRARYAIEDLLSAAHDARVALVVFAGEPYTVTPLTSDVATIRSLLDPLAPNLLPESGDQLASALDQAGRLLAAGPDPHGQIVVLTDGSFADPAQAMVTAQRLHRAGARVNVVGVGTSSGTPEPDGHGGFVHDSHGRLVMTRLQVDVLQHVAAAGGGRYEPLERLPRLIASLQAQGLSRFASAQAAPKLRVPHWRNDGVWLLPGLLIAAALLARRGWM